MTWRLPLFSALLMQRSASASEFIRTMAAASFYLQGCGSDSTISIFPKSRLKAFRSYNHTSLQKLLQSPSTKFCSTEPPLGSD
jgi:hypothetical protein